VEFDNCSTNAINYHWDFGDTSITNDTSILENPTWTYNAPGIYVVTLSSRDGCDFNIKDTITVNTVQDSLDGETTNCFQDSYPLNPDGNPDYVYIWEPSQFLDDATSENPLATVEDDTWFFVTITDPNLPDCPFRDSILLIIPDDFDIDIDGDDITSCTFDEIALTATLTGNTNVEIVWKDEDGNVIGTGLEVIVLPQVTTSYSIMATDTLGCMKSDTITINKPDPTFDVVITTNDTAYCYIQTITLTAVSVTGVTFEWFNANNELIGTGNTIDVTPGSEACFHVIGTDPLGCQAADTVCLSPTFFSLTITTDDEEFCDDGSAVLNVNPIDGVTYQWFDPNNVLVGTGLTVTVSPSDPTCYNVVGTDALGCQDTATACVTPIYFDVELTCDQGTCFGEPTTLTVIDHSGQNLTYLWSPGGETTSSITVTPTVQTTYTVIVTNEDLGCKDTLSCTVEVFEFIPAIAITADPPNPFFGQSSQLTVNQDPNFEYVWSATSGEILPPIYNPVVIPNDGATYCVTVTDFNGCTGEACITFSPPELFCDERDIFVPNAFSPNGDGENDEFRVRTNYALTDVEMRIFNRWGEQVFSASDINNGWNGLYNGKELEPDVFGYFLRVTCPDGSKYFKKGNISLLR
jgi:gliding motility-associated-like protein